MTNAYAASTMCGTSRYSTITGRLPSRSAYGRNLDKDLLESSIRVGDETSSFFLRDVIIPRTKLEDARGVEDAKDCTSNNLVAVLQQNGYNTGAVGKWHLGAKESINGEGLYDHYPQVQEEVRKCGFDFAEAIYRENLGGEKNLNVDGEYVTHNMEHVTAEAIRFIQQSVNSNKSGNNAMGTLETRKTKSDAQGHTPFFLYFNPTVPHSSGDVTDALLTGNCRDTVQGRLSEAPFVPYGMTANVGVGGNAGCRMYRKTVLERAAAAAASMGERDDPVDDSLAGAVWVDDAIGSLFETLEALDILDNTVILFQLDHGMDAKGSLFEGGSRIVQFVHYPDRIKVGGSGKSGEPTEQQGWKFDGLVSTVDIAPTLMDLAGVPSISRTSDGAVSGKDSINEDNDNQDNPAQYRYDMDGKSWFSEVVAANTNLEKEKNSFEQLQQSEQQVHRRRGNINYFQERCLFVEQGLDRSVRCGCYKYIYVSDLMDGFTAWRARKCILDRCSDQTDRVDCCICSGCFVPRINLILFRCNLRLHLKNNKEPTWIRTTFIIFVTKIQEII
jgi:arylsulfatase A-like enzyme